MVDQKDETLEILALGVEYLVQCSNKSHQQTLRRQQSTKHVACTGALPPRCRLLDNRSERVHIVHRPPNVAY